VRILGTAVGAFMGAAAALTLGQGAIALGAAVFLTILVCSYLTILHESFRMAGVTAAIVLLVGSQNGSLLLTVWDRFLEISIGVVVAVVVSLIVLPARARHSLGRGLGKSMEWLAELCDLVVVGYLGEAQVDSDRALALRRKIIAARAANRGLLVHAQREPGGLGRDSRAIAACMDFQGDAFMETMAMARALAEIVEENRPGEAGLRLELAAPIKALVQTGAESLRALAELLSRSGPRAFPDGLGQAGAQVLAERAQAIDRALADMDASLVAMRQRRASAAYDLDEVANFFAFVFSARQIAEGLRKLEGRLPEPDGPGPAEKEESVIRPGAAR